MCENAYVVELLIAERLREARAEGALRRLVAALAQARREDAAQEAPASSLRSHSRSMSFS